MSGTFKQNEQVARSKAEADKKRLRVMTAQGTLYGIGLNVMDPWDGKPSKITDLATPTLGQFLFSLESGSFVAVQAACWRMLDIDVEELT